MSHIKLQSFIFSYCLYTVNSADLQSSDPNLLPAVWVLWVLEALPWVHALLYHHTVTTCLILNARCLMVLLCRVSPAYILLTVLELLIAHLLTMPTSAVWDCYPLKICSILGSTGCGWDLSAEIHYHPAQILSDSELFKSLTDQFATEE